MGSSENFAITFPFNMSMVISFLPPIHHNSIPFPSIPPSLPFFSFLYAEKRAERMRGLDSITDTMDVNLSKHREIVKKREACHASCQEDGRIPILFIYFQKSSLITYSQMKSVQFSSVTQSCPTLCDPMNHSSQASLSITNSRSLLTLMFSESVMPSNHLILCHPLLLLPPISPSIRVFSNEYLGINLTKYKQDLHAKNYRTLVKEIKEKLFWKILYC